MRPMVYLCGPITGLSYQEARYGIRQQFANLVDGRINVLSPMRQEGHLCEVQNIAHEGYEEHPLSSERGIVAKDRLDVRRSDLVVALLSGAKAPSCGSLIELGWADAWRKPILLVMEDAGNPHDRLFVTELASFRTADIAEAAHMTNALLLPGI